MRHQVIIERATANDIPAIAALFTTSFKESVLHHCGCLPKPQAMQDVFQLVWRAEPQAALIARSVPEGDLIGYCFAPAQLSCLWVRAVLGGHIFKWAWRWMTGKYGFGFYPVKIILLNKLGFLRSALQTSEAAKARILSIAVAADWRGQGVASLMMKTALAYFEEKKATKVRLEVRPGNVSAIRVYQKMGFIEGGTMADSQGEWLIMFKEME